MCSVNHRHYLSVIIQQLYAACHGRQQRVFHRSSIRHRQHRQQQTRQWEEPVGGSGQSATGWHGNGSELRRRLVARLPVTSTTSDAVGVAAPRYKCRRQISPNFIRSLQFIIYRTYKRRRAMNGTSSLPLQQHSQHHQQQPQQQQHLQQHAKRLHVHHQHLASPSSSTDSAPVTSGKKSCDKSNQSSNFRSYVHSRGPGGRPGAPAGGRSPNIRLSVILSHQSTVGPANGRMWLRQLGSTEACCGT